MLKNYLLIAIRNFRRHKSSFFINLIGLSAGLTCSVLIMLWVLDELSVDKFHENGSRIFNVMEFQTYADGVFTTISTPGVLSLALKEEIPEIEYACTMTWPDESQLTHGDNKFRMKGRYADPDVLKIFSFPLIYGDPEAALEDPTSIVISRQAALNLFGREDVIGETVEYLSWDNGRFEVTGVLDEIPDQSTLDFEFLIPFEVFRKNNPWTTEWGNNGPRTYATIHEGVDHKELSEKIKDFVKSKNEDSSIELFLFPYEDYYLRGSWENGKQSGGRIVYVRIFTIVATFILLIACINFMNLSTARSARRAKEVGIRKTLGAIKQVLVGQFLGEAIVISFLSLFLSLALVAALLPSFNELTDKTISILSLFKPAYILGLITIALITGVLSGSYPALYLSSFIPVKVLKGRTENKGGEAFVRKGLVVFQYTLSVVLIIATAVIYLQIHFIQNKNLGYDQDNLMYLEVNGNLEDNYEVFAERLRKIPGVEEAGVVSHAFQGRNNNSGGVRWPGIAPETNILFEMVATDEHLIDIMDFEMAEGRFFSPEYGTDTSAVVINEKALEIMNLEEPVGTTIEFWDSEWKIIGVNKNFHFQSMRSEIAPMIMRYNPGFAWFFFIKLSGQNIARTISQVEEVYSELNPSYVFNYEFLDEEYARLYSSEIRVGKLAGYFGILAVLISCLGLFGLSAFTAERKTKEIGIRKTLGASFGSIIMLLSKDFTRLILIALVVAIPVGFYFMSEWLADYPYRIDLGWWIFAGSGAIAVLIAWLTISFQSIKAAHQNPIESLKIED